MTIGATTGAKIYIGPANEVADDSAEFEALTYVEVGDIESIGAFGDTSATIEFTSLSDARVRKRKGVRNAGDIPVVVADNPTDAGQTALIAAEASPGAFAFKSVTATRTRYFRALVASAQDSEKAANGILKVTYTLLVDSKIVPAA